MGFVFDRAGGTGGLPVRLADIAGHRRRTWTSAIAIAAVLLAGVPLVSSPAAAQSFGGTGGNGTAGAGGAGGSAGQTGSPGTGTSGGGGGGAGGFAGGAGAGGGGAGGAGGTNGMVVQTLAVPAGTSQTAGAGAGGVDAGNTIGGGGGGGAGGYGAIVTSNGGSNAGTLNGGDGGSGGTAGTSSGGTVVFFGNGGNGGDGGIGVMFAGAGITATNAMGGSVTGGNGGGGGSAGLTGALSSMATATYMGNGGTGGAGGTGVSFAGSGVSFTNAGSVTGGNGGGGGSAGLTEAVSSTVTATYMGNGGTGGAGGTGVSFAGSGVSFTNAGSVTGGNGGGGSAGETDFANSTATAIYNGIGGIGGAGGTGVAFAGSGVTFTNTGSVAGGTGGAGGGAGETNFVGTGTVIYMGNGGIGGVGGTGVAFAGSGVSFTNTGSVTGGNGGGGGSAGETIFVGTGTVTNNGSAGAGGPGGIGVIANGIVIDNTGSISGGFANGGAGPQAYAILFQSGRNFVGGSGQINGGIDVEGASVFQPALPGSGIGAPLAINGPLTFAATSTYQVRVAPDPADSVAVAGVATLNGAKVRVQIKPAIYAFGSRYTIVAASGGVAGTFSSVTGNLTFLRPVLSYDANDVYLGISKVPYVTAALTWNQRAVAGGLDNAYSIAADHFGEGGKILGALNALDAPRARAAFDSLSGEGITGAQNIAFRSSQLFTSSIFDQTTFYTGGGAANSVTLTERLPGVPAFLSLAPTERAPIRELADLPAARVAPVAPLPVATRTWRAWASGWGGTEHISGNASPIGSATQNNDIYGGSLGVDYQLLPNYLVGVALGGSNGDFRVDQRATSGTTTGGHIAIYDIADFGPYYGASSTAFSYFDNKTNRYVAGFGGLAGEQERGQFNSNEFRSRIEFGRHIAGLPGLGGLPGLTGFGTVTPFVAIELASLRSNGFTETSLSGPGLYHLNVSGQSTASVPGSLGLRFQKVADLGNGMVLSPTLQVAYLHEFAPYRSQIGTLTSLPGSTFLVDGARPSRNAAQVKAGTELALGPRSAVFVNFDGELSGVNQLYAGKGGFRYLW